MKSIIFLGMAIASFSALANSPKTIEYRKSFDEMGEINFSQKMGFDSFEISKEEVFPIGGEYTCRTELEPKKEKAASMLAGESQFKLTKVVTLSPYTYCKKLPDFASITDESRRDKAAQIILMEYVDGEEKVILKLYGNKRVKIYDKGRDANFTGKITEAY